MRTCRQCGNDDFITTLDYKLLVQITDVEVDFPFGSKKVTYVCSHCGRKEKYTNYDDVDDSVAKKTKKKIENDASGFLQSKCGGFEWNGHVVASVSITNNGEFLWRAIKEATLTCTRCGERKEWNEPQGWVCAMNIKCKCGNDDFIVLTAFKGVLVPVVNNSYYYPYQEPFMHAVCSKCFETLEEKLPWPPGIQNVTEKEARQQGEYAQACTTCGNKIMYVYTSEITKLIANKKDIFYEKKGFIDETVLCWGCGAEITPWMFVDEKHSIGDAILGGLLGAVTAGAGAFEDALADSDGFITPTDTSGY